MSVTCIGQKATQNINITFMNNLTALNLISSQFTITIPGLFSPPAINPLDIITISSYDSSSYGLDTCSTQITNLQPQPFSMIIQPSLNPLYIDSLTALSFNFTNPDTISRDDYFEIAFPNPTTINYISKTSNFAFSSVTYNATTLTLRFYQSLSASNTNINASNYIKFLNYRSPLTTKTTNNIVLSIYNYAGRKKMEGKNQITAQQKVYNILNQSANFVGINDFGSYYLTFNISNTVTSNAMLKIFIAAELSIAANSSTCPSLVNMISPGLSCTINLTATPQFILVKSLFSSIPSGQYNVKIPSIINPSYSLNLSQFKIYLYYN